MVVVSGRCVVYGKELAHFALCYLFGSLVQPRLDVVCRGVGYETKRVTWLDNAYGMRS